MTTKIVISLFSFLEIILVFWVSFGGIKLSLTKRQQEFLACIFEQYLKDGNPVHYTTVAKRLGVSKWTAYDMLKRLEEAGYLSSHYGLKEKGNPGRSQLFYTPTSKVKQLSEENADKQENWLVWRQLLIEKVEKLQSATAGSGHNQIEELLALLPEAKDSITYCACLIALFAAYIKVFNEQGMKLIRQVIELIKKPEQRLSLFCGTIIGTLSLSDSALAGTMENGKEGSVTKLVNKLQQRLMEIDLKQCRILDGFLSDLLQAVS